MAKSRFAVVFGAAILMLFSAAVARAIDRPEDLDGNAENGREAYEVCATCHLKTGAGRPDGSFPQIAGQHSTVVIKQFTDIRQRRRDNPIMEPFARAFTDPQQLADLAAYIESLPIPRDNGRGPGTNLERGRTLYQRDCQRCHGIVGQGNANLLVPVVAGQHYRYAMRQIGDMAGGQRRNADPEMVAPLRSYTREDLAAVADYLSRLEWPERQSAKESATD